MKQILIENWSKAYKYLSVQISAVMLFLSLAYEHLPAIQSYVPSNYMVSVASALIIFARIVKQKQKDD